MTGSDWLTDDLIEATFARRARRAAPDDLRRDILTATMAASQRAAWRVRLADSLATPALRPAWVAILVLVALLGSALAIALIGQHARPAQQGLLAYVQNGDIYLANPDGSGATRVVHDDGVAFSAPLWAPGGRWLAVEGPDGEFIFDPQTLGLRRVLDVPVSGLDRVWSSDGDSLAVAVISAEGATTIDIVTIDTTAVRELQPKLAEGASLGSVAWSPDGRWFLGSTYPTVCQSGCRPGGNRMVRIDATTGDTIDVAPIGQYAEFSAEWSPDSRRFAYADAGECSTEACPRTIVVADADLARQVTITDPATVAADPRWSPDGSWIAFTSDSSRRPAQERHAYVSTLWIVRPDGRDARTLVDFADADAAINGFSWRADGEGILFRKFDRSGRSALGVFEVRISDGSLRPVLQPGLEGYGWQTIPADGPVPTLPNHAPIATPALESRAPLRSPPAAPPADPSQSWSGIAFDGYCSAGVLDLRTLAERIVGSTCPESGGDLVFAPDGATYAFASPDRSVTVARADGSTSRALEPVVGAGGGNAEVQMHWSPDGRWLSVRRCGQESNGDCARFEDLVVSPDGQTQHDLTATPAWSGDGRKLVVEDGGNVLVGSPDGSNLQMIGRFPMPRSWSPDGAQFAFIRNGDAWVANTDGSGERDVAHFEYGGTSDAVWSPDGRFIAVIQGSRLVIVPTAGGDPLPVDLGPGRIGFYSVVFPGATQVAWSPDGTHLAMSVDRSGAPAAMIVRASDWTATALDGDDIDFLAWSPDGRFIALKGFATGVLDVANSDGSGRHTLWKAPDSTAGMTWVP